MKKFAPLLLLIAALSLQRLQAQDYSAQAKAYFSQYMSTQDINALVTRSLPTEEDCRHVFVPGAVDTYVKFLDQTRLAMQTDPGGTAETFVDMRIEVFSTQDILMGKGNYAGGMAMIADKLQPYVLFYEVNYLREVGARLGVAQKYWVYLNGKWLLFPKPWRAFE